MLASARHSPWFARSARPAHGVSPHAAEAAPRGWAPRVDVREEAARFVVAVDLPGVDPAEVELRTEGNVLSLSGERKAEAQADGARFTRIERRHGRFERRFALPESADAAAASATGRNGVIEISIPKKPESAPRRIAIA